MSRDRHVPSTRKVLIVKMGYSETLDPEVSRSPSLGDVFRTTVLLNLYRKDRVTWLTAPAAYPLLAGNPYIERVVFDDPGSLSALGSERFDLVVNLEKVPELCRWSEELAAKKHFGFGYSFEKGEVVPHAGSADAFGIAKGEGTKRENLRNWSEVLFEMAGHLWKGEEYVLGYRPKGEVAHDLGFNMHVGPKWPTKGWPMDSWRRLEDWLGGRYSIAYQESLNDLYGYMDWIASVRCLVSNDSLGIHLALALGKKVVVLFGPTSSREIHFWNRGIALVPDRDLSCMPCFAATCAHNGRTCLEYIRPRIVADAIDHLMAGEPLEDAPAVAVA